MTRSSFSNHLEEQILSGELPVGTKLPSERQLAEQCGLSRTIVREVLRGLIERNLVEVQPGRGAFVRGACATDAAQGLGLLVRRHQATPRDLVEARTMLESTAAALAAERLTPADLASMDSALAQFDRASGLIEQTRADMAFHMSIARAARNPVIETMFGAITGLILELMLRSLSDPAVAPTATPKHHAIYEAIRDRDAERARAAMANHLSVADTLYGDDYDRNLGSVARRELTRLFAPGFTLDDLLDAAVGSRDEV